MTRADWWLGVGAIVLAIMVHSTFPRYEWHPLGGAMIRIDHWRGETVMVLPSRREPVPVAADKAHQPSGVGGTATVDDILSIEPPKPTTQERDWFKDNAIKTVPPDDASKPTRRGRP